MIRVCRALSSMLTSFMSCFLVTFVGCFVRDICNTSKQILSWRSHGQFSARCTWRDGQSTKVPCICGRDPYIWVRLYRGSKYRERPIPPYRKISIYGCLYIGDPPYGGPLDRKGPIQRPLCTGHFM